MLLSSWLLPHLQDAEERPQPVAVLAQEMASLKSSLTALQRCFSAEVFYCSVTPMLCRQKLWMRPQSLLPT